MLVTLAASAACDHGGLRLEEPALPVASTPLDGALGVPRNAEIRVRYDRRLAPWTVHRGTIRVGSGSASAFLSVRYDPVRLEIVAVPFERPLVANVDYTIFVEGPRDLDGVLVEPFEAGFSTGATSGEPPRAGTTRWEAVEPIVRETCAPCHDASDPIGLDLSTPEGWQATALGVPAIQTGDREAFPERGLTGLPRVDVIAGNGRPATSYLVYKLLDDPHIVGERMPPEASLTVAEITAIADWIQGGARFE